MLHRLAVILIIAFWLAMSALLVVREMYPEATRFSEVPVTHVGRLMFQHEQTSQLDIYDKEKQEGVVYVHPRRLVGGRSQVLDLNGSLGIHLPLGGKQRLSWTSSIQMDSSFDVQRVFLTLTAHDSQTTLELDLEPRKNIARFTVLSGSAIIEKGHFTLDMAGLESLMARAGLPVFLLKQAVATQDKSGEMQITANQTTTRISGESISVYRVSVEMDGRTFVEADVTELGQIVRAAVPVLSLKLKPQNVRE